MRSAQSTICNLQSAIALACQNHDNWSENNVAGAAPEPIAKNYMGQRARMRALALPRLHALRWLPPLLLALATLLAVVAAYRARPSVTIDLGDYYDTPFLPYTGARDATDTDFFAREIGATGADQAVYPWPVGQ